MLSFQARYGILRESARSEPPELLLENPQRTSGAGTFLSQSRRLIPTAHGFLNERKEFNEGAFKDLALINSGKDIVNVENAVQAVILSENRCALQDTQEYDKNEPSDLLTAMDSFDNLFCRRCLVRTQPRPILDSHRLSFGSSNSATL